MKRISVSGLVAALLLGGCQTAKVGPKALRTFQGAYNEAITVNKDEQLLQNIVRLRYRDNPVFLEVNKITQTNDLGNSGGLGWDKIITAGDGKYTGTMKPSLGASGKNQSVIDFGELKGKDFVQKMLTPIQLPIVMSMLESGWRPERVFNLCVQRVNHLYNAPTAGASTPHFAPEYKRFYRWTELLTRLYRAHVLEFGDKPETNFSDMFMRVSEIPVFKKEIAEFKALAELDSQSDWYKIKDNFADMGPSKLTVRCRPLLSMLFLLSQGVDVPEEEREAGLVTTTKNLDGTDFDWSDISCRLLNVHFSESSSKTRPAGAYVACRYRGKWFYIKDNDTESKATFLLMTQIFTLQSAATYRKTEPTLVIAGH